MRDGLKPTLKPSRKPDRGYDRSRIRQGNLELRPGERRPLTAERAVGRTKRLEHVSARVRLMKYAVRAHDKVGIL